MTTTLKNTVEQATLNGKEYAQGQVITINDVLLSKYNLNGLLFLEPEDIGIFGELSCKAEIDGVNCEILFVLPLKDNELEEYNKQGLQAIINILANENRDFLSIS